MKLLLHPGWMDFTLEIPFPLLRPFFAARNKFSCFPLWFSAVMPGNKALNPRLILPAKTWEDARSNTKSSLKETQAESLQGGIVGNGVWLSLGSPKVENRDSTFRHHKCQSFNDNAQGIGRANPLAIL